MDKEEQLRKDYQQTRIRLEDQEDDIKALQRKGQKIAEEAYSELNYILLDRSENDDSLNEARIELTYLEEDLLAELNREKKKVILQQEDAEQQYKSDLKKLREGE
ncbi:hypothetical protein RAK27_18950 [Carnobacterium maltaromaticum]|uniref:Uncharacterized protein n=1 Tax=Carnobacterium maltaromaticum TaxID=2751 RepID=A0AAW9K4K8_CARML|nr:hypothetical protein [Carnobacterium maltaromaticum]MDZ5760725.1 hypothetical protein [Carnobacterium maltaromaticum]